MKGKSDRINHFLLQEQFPDIIKVAGGEKRSSSQGSSSKAPGTGSSSVAPPSATKHSVSRRIVTAVDYVTQQRLDGYRCPHLEEYLPRILDITHCKTTPNEHHPKGWTLSNPVHALHMVASQTGGESSSSKIQRQRLPPSFMYGEEQHRTIALQTEGIVEYWCSFYGNAADSNATTMMQKYSKLSTKPAAPNLPKEKLSSSSQPVPSPSSSYSRIRGLKSSSDVPTPATIMPTPQTVVSASETSSRKAGIPLPGSGTDGSIGIGMKSQFNAKTRPHDTKTNAPMNSSNNVNVKNEGDAAIAAIPTGSQDNMQKSAEPASNSIATDEQQGISGTNDGVPMTTEVNAKDNHRDMKPESEKNESSAAWAEQSGPANEANAPNDDPSNSASVPKEEDNRMEIDLEDSANHRASSPKPESTPTNDIESPKATTGISKETIQESTVLSVNLEKVAPAEASEKGEAKDSDMVKKEQDGHRKESEGNIACESKGQDASSTTREKLQSVASEEKGKSTPTDISDVAKVAGNAVITGNARIMTPTTATDDPMEVEKTTDTPSDANNSEKKTSATDNDNDNDNVVLLMKEGRKVGGQAPNIPKLDLLTQAGRSQETTMTTAAILPDTAASTGVATPSQVTSITSATSAQGDLVRSKNVHLPHQSDPAMDHFRREEDKIRRVRRSLMSKRVRKKPVDPSPKDVAKKKRKGSDKFSIAPGWKVPPLKELSSDDEKLYLHTKTNANETTERWMSQFRHTYESYWAEKDNQKRSKHKKQCSSFYLNDELLTEKPFCQWCTTEEEEKLLKGRRKSRMREHRVFTGDELMQCLDCSFIGCSPSSLNPDTRQHMQQHSLITGHNFAVSCGEKAQVFCFACGDFVFHEIFEQEKIRIACSKKLTHLAWNKHAVLRSFDPFQFVKTPESGILWRGLVATYPSLVPKEHFCAAQLSLRRQVLFEGNTSEKWILPKSNALYFAASQSMKDDQDRFKIAAPVGIYNLGNTCFMSAVLQCLVFCKPLQQYFLRDTGHHYKSCEVFRHKEDVLTAAAAASSPTRNIALKAKKSGTTTIVKKKTQKIQSEICLACEMDRLFLSYYGGTVGNDICVPIEESSRHLLSGNPSESSVDSLDEIVVPIEKGDPLIISDLLTSAWKSGGMNHLKGYDQHDAHEFLNSFLELLGKHIVKFRHRVYDAAAKVYRDNVFMPELDSTKIDIVKNSFEGSLRSVLLCENCGVKRVQQEPFMNVSLSLSEEVERMQEGRGLEEFDDMSVEMCLEHFVLPEKLGDLVYCNSCGKRTQTKKQHTFAKLPRILCLHLKRFDAAKNKKIENFVSFPSHGLNMGGLFSHWCEVTTSESSAMSGEGSMPSVEPKILYDLFGTVNHIGNMQSGHYVANVKVDGKWHHCNDQHISYADEESVLKAEGAYVLFYQRR